MQNSSCITNWQPYSYYHIEKSCVPYGIMILNAIITPDLTPKSLLDIWNKADVRVTVDGGTNLWSKWLKNNNLTSAVDIDLITGDMDSIDADLLYFYEKSVYTTVVRTLDQEETDFTKSLRELQKYLVQKNKQIQVLIVLDETAGRFDQIMANISTLYKIHFDTILPGVKVIKVANKSLTWLLPKGQHTIDIPKGPIKHSSWCSLIPVGQPCIVTTRGLKWNLNNFQLEFGKLISTSNTYSGEEETVFVETDRPIIWSMSTKKFNSYCT